MLLFVNMYTQIIGAAVNTASQLNTWLAIADIAIPCISGLVGVILGAVLTSKSSKKQIRIQLLSEAYADVFKAYTDYVNSFSKEALLDFVAASERTMLFCSPEAEKILMAMRYEMSDRNADGKKCSALLVALREEAKRDINAKT